jgi:hypothetical protein
MGKSQLLRVLLLPGLQVAEFSYLHNLYTSAFSKSGQKLSYLGALRRKYTGSKDDSPLQGAGQSSAKDL